MKKYCFYLLTFVLIAVKSYSQNFNVTGNAFGITPFNNSCPSDTCFTLTPDRLWQTGAVYNNQLFDLSSPFDGTFCLFLGTKDATGADGFAFILKDTNTPLLGLPGGGIGYGSLSPSIAIEFDTWDNTGNDIPEDHTSLNYNGNSFVPIVPSIPLLPSGANVEDGVPHTARIVWTPHDTTIYMFFDNHLRFTHKVDLVNTIFGGKTKVNWGFTSSTGGSSNLQQICFPSKPISDFFDTVCDNECLNFNQISYDNNYSYTWNNGILDTLPSTILCPLSSKIYLLFKQSKLTGIVDTINIHVFLETTPELDLGMDIILCEGSVELDATINFGLNYLWSEGSQTNILSVYDTGIYWVEAETKYCIVKDTIWVICPEIPNVFTPNGDGINDYFSPFQDYSFSEGTLQIYNRWGNIVFETSEPNSIRNGWDGNNNNKECSIGVYYYTFSYKSNLNQESIHIKGSLSLYR